MIKVLLTGPSLNESVGGIAIHVNNLLEIFQDNPDVKIDHFPITAAKYNRESWAKKVQRLTHIIWPYMVKLNTYDAIHLNSTFDNRSVIRDLFYAIIAILVKGHNVIFQFHGGEPSNVILFKYKMLRNVFRWVFNRGRHVLVLSQFQQRQFETYFPKANVILVPNCIPVPVKEPKLKNDNIVNFLFIGRISESKGILKIIEAAKLLLENQCKFEINICGKGPLEEKLLEEISSKSLQKYVKYLGFVSGQTKEYVLHEADVMLLPTDHNEGFPYALLEAFSYAIPVIGTKKGAIPEVIDDGINGFIIESNDEESLFEKMRFFCHSPEKAISMGNNGRNKLTEKYTADVLLKKLTAVYSC
jgi:glycosyltransferase involved in cell wall biosynthesis